MAALDDESSMSSDDVDSTDEQLRRMDEKLRRTAERRREKTSTSESSSSSPSSSSKQNCDGDDDDLTLSSSSSDNDDVENKDRQKIAPRKPPSTTECTPPREITMKTESNPSEPLSSKAHSTNDVLSDSDFEFSDDEEIAKAMADLTSTKPSPSSFLSPTLVANPYAKRKALSISTTAEKCTTATKKTPKSPDENRATNNQSATILAVTNPYSKRKPTEQYATQHSKSPGTSAEPKELNTRAPVLTPHTGVSSTKKTPPGANFNTRTTKNGEYIDTQQVSPIERTGTALVSDAVLQANGSSDAFAFFDDDSELHEVTSSRSFGATRRATQAATTVEPGRVSLSPLVPTRTNDHDDQQQRVEEQMISDKSYLVQLEDNTEDPVDHVIDFSAVDDSKSPEIHHSLYSPPPFDPGAEPYVHSFNLCTRPWKSRRTLPVSEAFSPPVNLMWKSKFKTFNHMQTELMNVLAHSNDNFLISSPTGSGKSTIFDIAMARLIVADLQNHSAMVGQKPRLSKERKMVYVAPSKALCEERYRDWCARMAELDLGIEVAMITGDAEPGASFTELASAHLIVTTPEKFDSLSRRWTEKFFLFASIKLFMIDEVHQLGDESRGWCLETIVCRMKTIQRAAQNVSVNDLSSSSYEATTPAAIASSMRMVGVSATLPNIADVAALIEANECYTFDQSYRPVPLKTHVMGLGWVGKNQFAFWNNLDRRVPEIISRFSNNKPTIVFCHSKKETEKLAELLTQSDGMQVSNSTARMEFAKGAGVNKLKLCLQRGIGYHHAGLDIQDRRLLEKGFSDGYVRVLCATTTLAMGVNLPVHLVIIKGTTCWRGSASGYQELDAASLLQMTGRAGRPGFDTSGTAVIMTDNASKERVQKLASGLDAAESRLQNKLPEVISSEISQRVITSSESALNWIKRTLFFVRVRKNPQKFGIRVVTDQAIDAFLLYQCEKEIRRLKEMGLVREDEHDELLPCPGSHIMSANLVDIQAAELLISLPFDASICQILSAISQIKDIQRPVRRNEKAKLNEAHRDIKFKLPGPPSKIRIKQPSEKTFVLLQCAIGQINLEDYTLRQEMGAMIEYCSRMLSALEEYSAKGSRNGHVAAQSLKLRRSLAESLWSEHDGILNIFRGMGHVSTGRLRMNGITSLQDVLNTSEEALEKATNRAKPFGSTLRSHVEELLHSKLTLTASVSFNEGTNLSYVVCNLEPQDPQLYKAPQSKESARVTYTIVAYTDKAGGCLMFQDNIIRPDKIKFRCPQQFGLITVTAIASIVGFDEKVELKGTGKIEKSSFTTSYADKRSHSKQAPTKTLTQQTLGKSKVAAQKSGGRTRALFGNAGENDTRIKAKVATKRPIECAIENNVMAAGPYQKSPRVVGPSPPHQSESNQKDPPPANQQMQLSQGPPLSQPGDISNWFPPTTTPQVEATQQPSSMNQQRPASQRGPRSQPRDTNNLLPPRTIAQPGIIQTQPPSANQQLPGSERGPAQSRPRDTSNWPASSTAPFNDISYYRRDDLRANREHFGHGETYSQRCAQTQANDVSARPNHASTWDTVEAANTGVLQCSPLPHQPGNHRQTNQNRYASSQSSSHTPTPPTGHSSVAGKAGQRTSFAGHNSATAQKRIDGSASRNERKSSWRQEKREQEKKQDRAFTSRKDNPFTNFKHDPNDGENILEQLNSTNETLRESSLIPQQELEAYRNSANQRPSGLVAKKFTTYPRGRRGRSRYFPSSRRVSEPELLAAKAAEQQAYAAASKNSARRHVSPMPQLRPLAAALPRTMTPGNFSIVTEQSMGNPRCHPPQYMYPPQAEAQFYGDPWEHHQQQVRSGYSFTAQPIQEPAPSFQNYPSLQHYYDDVSVNEDPMIDTNQYYGPGFDRMDLPVMDQDYIPDFLQQQGQASRPQAIYRENTSFPPFRPTGVEHTQENLDEAFF